MMSERKRTRVVLVSLAVALLAWLWVAWAIGYPQLIAATLIVVVLVAIDLFGIPDALRAGYRRHKVIFAPFLAIALLVGTTSYPFVLTPGFLAPEVPVAALHDDLDGYLYHRVRVRGKVSMAEPFPFGIGNVEMYSMDLVGADGQRLFLLFDRLASSSMPQAGDEVVVTGVVEYFGGPDARFVGAVDVVASSPAARPN
jgi:hypothetical protein